MKQPRRKQKYCKATRSRSTKPSCTKAAEADEIRCHRTGKTRRPNVQAKRLSLSIGAALPPRLCERLPTTRVALRREAQGSHRDSRNFFARLWREMCVAAKLSMALVGACVVEVAPVADGAVVLGPRMAPDGSPPVPRMVEVAAMAYGGTLMVSVGACVVEVAPVADEAVVLVPRMASDGASPVPRMAPAAVELRMQHAFCISHHANQPTPYIACSRNSEEYP